MRCSHKSTTVTNRKVKWHWVEEIVFYNTVNLSVSIDSLLCDPCGLTLFYHLIFSSHISRHALCAQHPDLTLSGSFLSVFPCRTLQGCYDGGRWWRGGGGQHKYIPTLNVLQSILTSTMLSITYFAL